jgi:hypothetical protein
MPIAPAKALLMTPETIVRYWKYVEVKGPDDCWPWLAGKHKKMPYGQFNIRSPDGSWRLVLAHRVAYLLGHGEQPMQVTRHSCDNGWCQNPKHLSQGTFQDNIDDRTRKERSNLNTKLTGTQVAKIKQHLYYGTKQKDIAAKFNVSEQLICDIKKGRRWDL